MKNRYAHYTYTITNKVSLVMLGIVVIVAGSLFIRFLAAIPPPIADDVLVVAWSVWGLAFVIRGAQWIIGYLLGES